MGLLGSWSAYYNFDEYLYQPDPKVDAGLGVFGRFGVSDGDANPIKYFASAGFVGRGIVPGRMHDQLGVGYYHICAADARPVGPLRFGDSWGVEAFYGFAITPGVFLSPNVQVIEPGQESIDTACILGVRLTTRF